MSPENRGRRHGTDVSFETCFDRVSFAPIRNHRKNFFRLENLFCGHRKRLLGNLRNIGEPCLADLLLPARLVEIDDDVRFLGVEIGRWIVERDVPVLTDAEKGDVNRRRGNLSADLASHYGWIGGISGEQ